MNSVDEAARAAARAVVDLVDRAWADGDADAFAAAFTETGTMVLSGNRWFRGRPQIREQMTAAFAGPLKGTALTERLVDLQSPAAGVTLLITEGGILAPGDAEVAWERALRATWVLVEDRGQWLVAAYQNGRMADGAPPTARGTAE